MAQRKQRTVENAIGQGKVYRNDQWIADVQYNLQVRQEYLIAHTLGRSQSEVPGVKNVTGQIQVLNGEHDLMSRQEILALHLGDGRKWQFFTSGGNIIAGTYFAAIGGT